MKVKDMIITLGFINALASITGLACLVERNITLQILIAFISIINAFSMKFAFSKDIEFNLLPLYSFSIFVWLTALLDQLSIYNIVSSILFSCIILLNIISLFIVIDIAFFHKKGV